MKKSSTPFAVAAIVAVPFVIAAEASAALPAKRDALRKQPAASHQSARITPKYHVTVVVTAPEIKRSGDMTEKVAAWEGILTPAR